MSGSELGVSVLIPTFNRANFLPEAIDSVLSQDHPNLELIVLDDGSTDETPELLARYAKQHPPQRFRSVRHDNVGQSRTLNRGFELVTKELTGYLSSDDMLLPGAISRLVAVFVAEPETVVAYPAWDYVDEGGEKMDEVMPTEFDLLEVVRSSNPVIGPGALLQRWAIDEVGGWDPEIRFSPDFEFWLRVATLGPFRRVPETLAHYRWHEGMTGRSSDGLQIARERVAIVDRVYALPNLPPELMAVKKEAYRSAYLAGAGLLGGNAPWERFFLADRLLNHTFPTREHKLAETGEELRTRLAELDAELDEVTARIAALGDSLARREMEIEQRNGN